MTNNTQSRNNGLDTASMPPPNILFPHSQHDAQVEWTLAQRVFIPIIRYLFLGFVGLILWAISQGFIVSPWKGDIDKNSLDQKTAIAELRTNQVTVMKALETHDAILAHMEDMTHRIELSIAKIEERIPPRAPDLAANSSAPLPAAPRYPIPIKKPRIQTEEWRTAPH